MASDPIPAQLHAYLDSLVPERPAELQAMEAYAREVDFPIVGPASGYLCYQVARMIGARRILSLARAMATRPPGSRAPCRRTAATAVHHVVWDEDLSRRARGHLAALGFEDLIKYHVGEAVQALREADGPFDLIFNDINKDCCPASLPVISGKLRAGGVLIIDNMIWHGAIFDAKRPLRVHRGRPRDSPACSPPIGWVPRCCPCAMA